jgi:hypothetical protein
MGGAAMNEQKKPWWKSDFAYFEWTKGDVDRIYMGLTPAGAVVLVVICIICAIT